MPTFSPAFFSRSSSVQPCRLFTASFGAAAALLLTAGAQAQSTTIVFTAVQVPTLSHQGNMFSQPLIATLDPAPLAATNTESLPDAPSAVTGFSSSSIAVASATVSDPAADETKAGRTYPRAAQPTDITVLPGQTAPRQTVRNKLVGSVRDSVSPFTFGGEIISAGYSQITNGSPNYGTNATAFGQRFGAAVARGTSQNLFYEGAMAAILHEDPRYYQMGTGHSFFKRLVYAGTRPLITRTDSGKTTPNLALLSGYLGAAALTKVYYPQINQGFNQTLQTYGGSIGGAALGYVVSEFLSDTLQIVHLKKAD